MTVPPVALAERYPRLAELIGIDLRSLALLRILVGFCLLLSLLAALGDPRAFYSDDGVLPRTAMIASDGDWRLSLYLINGQTLFVTTLLLVQLGLALMLMLGLRARGAAIGSFLLWISLLNRNPLLVDHGDVLLGALLFWLMFLPLGARHAFDAALARNQRPRANLHVSFASLGLLLQIACVFLFAAILQSGPEWLPEFSAGYYLLRPEREALFTARWLLELPAALQALTLLAWLALWLCPLLLFAPYGLRVLRLLGIVGLALMSLGLAFGLRLGLFPWLMLFALSAFIGGWLWDALARRCSSGADLTLYYDRDCSYCRRVCLVLRELLLLPDLRLMPAQDQPRARALLDANRSWVFIDRDEQAYLKWPALVALLRRSPLFAPLWPLLRLPALVGPGNRVYERLGDQRARLARLTALCLAEREPQWEVPARVQRVAAAAVVLVLALNLQSAQLLPAFSAGAVQALGRGIGLEQRWDRFAPSPVKDHGWWVLSARLADDREIDLLSGQPPDYSADAARRHDNRRWRNLEARLWERNDASLYAAYADWHCRQWNTSTRAAGKRALNLKLVYMLERTPPPGASAQLEQIVAARHDCASAISPP